MKITVYNKKEVNVKETDTTGTYAYVVALLCGGLMEDPELRYEDYQIIRADSPRDAVEKYNLINNCSYYYGKVVGILDDCANGGNLCLI